ncbi:MAG: hypothetical protein IT305_24525 [Chloroflexi bacterium]|nr:hypothetical protein [Chloroflexota bacterium]
MAVDLTGSINRQRKVVTSPRGAAPNRPEQGEVLVADRFELVATALPPGAIRQRLGEADDVAWPPTEAAAQPQHGQTEPGSLALSEPR